VAISGYSFFGYVYDEILMDGTWRRASVGTSDAGPYFGAGKRRV
jgi:hypothetical protein